MAACTSSGGYFHLEIRRNILKGTIHLARPTKSSNTVRIVFRAWRRALRGHDSKLRTTFRETSKDVVFSLPNQMVWTPLLTRVITKLEHSVMPTFSSWLWISHWKFSCFQSRRYGPPFWRMICLQGVQNDPIYQAEASAFSNKMAAEQNQRGHLLLPHQSIEMRGKHGCSALAQENYSPSLVRASDNLDKDEESGEHQAHGLLEHVPAIPGWLELRNSTNFGDSDAEDSFNVFEMSIIDTLQVSFFMNYFSHSLRGRREDYERDLQMIGVTSVHWRRLSFTDFTCPYTKSSLWLRLEQIFGGAGAPEHISQVLGRNRRPSDRVIILIYCEAFIGVQRGHDDRIEDHTIVCQPKGILREECLERPRSVASPWVCMLQVLDGDWRPPDRVIILIRWGVCTDIHKGHDDRIEDHTIHCLSA